MNKIKNINQIKEQLQEIEKLFSSNKKKEILEDEILDLLGEIGKKVCEIIGDKKERTEEEKEEVFQRYLSLNKIDLDYISINEKMDNLVAYIYKEVTKRKKILSHTIFQNGETNIVGGKENKKIELKIAPKEKIFLKVLYEKGYKDFQIDQREEKLDAEKMRQIPYQIFYLQKDNKKKTILISDEIGEATFIYEGIIDSSDFQSIEKGGTIGGSKALKITYRKSTYRKNLKIALDDNLTFEEKIKLIKNESEEIADNEEITSKEYYKNISFEDFKKDLQNITKFITENEEEKINGLSLYSIYSGYLNYKLNIKSPKERRNYAGVIIKLLEEVKLGKISSFEKLNERFSKEKESNIKPKDYYENITFEEFKKDLRSIKNFKQRNEKDKIKGLSFKRIYNGYFNYKLNIKNPKEKELYYGLIVNLLKEVKLGKISSFEELNERFLKEKESNIKSKDYYENITFEEFKKDLENIKKFATTNKKEQIKGFSFFSIYDGYLNFKVGIKNLKKRYGYYGIIVKLLKEVKLGKISSFEELNERLSKEKESKISSKEYYENITFEEFKKDLENITKFICANKNQIKGLSFLSIYDGYLNFKLNINYTKRSTYHGIIVKLLEKVKTGEINSFEDLDKIFLEKKAKKDKTKKID